MEKDLIKFMENITFINKELAKYEDPKGNICYIPIGQLVCNCSYNELDKNEFTIAAFNKLVDTDKNYNEIKIKKAVSKQEITKKPEDKYILTDKELLVKEVWIVQNSLKASSSFTTKEEALSVLNEINDKVLKQAEII